MQDKDILINYIYELKSFKKQLDEAIEKLKNEVLEKLKNSVIAIDDEISKKESELLSIMKESNIVVDESVDNIVAALFKKENIGYTDDSEVLSYLKSIGRSDLIKTKTTESLDKVGIKKAIKTDSSLAESLSNMTTHSITEYVVVTSSDNYKKMLEHINESSSK